jgi:MFS transporter, OFA family, oxalate/formate antiporter
MHQRPRIFYGYIIVALCYILSMIIWGGYNSFGVFFSSLLDEFHWTRASTSAAFSLCTLISGVAAILVGNLVDKYGPRALMTACSLLLGLGYIGLSRINSVWQLDLVYGVIIGIGLSGFWIPVLSTIARWFSRKRGLMLGITLTGAGGGTFIAPLISNWLIGQYAWRTSLVVIGATTLAAGLVLSQFIKRDPSQIGQLPDGAEVEKGESEKLTERNMAGYSLKEALVTFQFWMATAILLCSGVGCYMILVHIVPHALALEISPGSAAGILAVLGAVSILGGLFTGTLADRIGIKLVIIIGLAIMSLALIWLLFAGEVWQLYLFAVFFGLIFGSVGVMETLLIVWLFGLRSNALILSAIDFGFIIGASLGPFLAGYVFDVKGSYYLAFLLAAVISVLGLVLSCLIKPTSLRR